MNDSFAIDAKTFLAVTGSKKFDRVTFLNGHVFHITEDRCAGEVVTAYRHEETSALPFIEMKSAYPAIPAMRLIPCIPPDGQVRFDITFKPAEDLPAVVPIIPVDLTAPVKPTPVDQLLVTVTEGGSESRLTSDGWFLVRDFSKPIDFGPVDLDLLSELSEFTAAEVSRFGFQCVDFWRGYVAATDGKSLVISDEAPVSIDEKAGKRRVSIYPAVIKRMKSIRSKLKMKNEPVHLRLFGAWSKVINNEDGKQTVIDIPRIAALQCGPVTVFSREQDIMQTLDHLAVVPRTDRSFTVKTADVVAACERMERAIAGTRQQTDSAETLGLIVRGAEVFFEHKLRADDEQPTASVKLPSAEVDTFTADSEFGYHRWFVPRYLSSVAKYCGPEVQFGWRASHTNTPVVIRSITKKRYGCVMPVSRKVK